MHRSLRWGSLAAFGLVALVLLAGVASAHADLVGADPNPNSRLDEAPDELVLRFSEQVEDRYTRVQVFGPDGERLDAGNEIDPSTRTSVRVPLEPVPDGVTTVRWRTLSVDTHTKSGVYILAINASLGGSDGQGLPATNASTGDESASQGSWGEALSRGMGFMGAALGVGLPAVWLALDRTSLSTRARRKVFKGGAGGHLLAAGMTVALAWFIGARIEADLATAFGTSSGQWLAARLALHLVAGSLLLAALRAREARLSGAFAGASIATGVGAMVATSLAGHAAAVAEGAALLVSMDVIHQVLVAFWVAGVGLLLWLAWTPAEDTALGPIVERLSPWFVVSVAGIALTGSYASWVHLDRVSDLWSSGYGQALVVKIVLLVGLAGLGAFHRYRLGPRLDQAVGSARRTFRRSISAEVLLMIIVLVAAGALTNVAPPGPAGAGPAQGLPGDEDNGTAGPQPVRSFVDGRFNVSVFITPEPVQVGVQNLTVEVSMHHGDLPENAAVIVRLHPPSDPNGEGDSFRMEPDANGTFSREGTIFVEEGTWGVLVAFQGKGVYMQDEFELEVGAPGE